MREFKNQSDGKKADGAILKDDKAIAVIELKSTKTKDLTSITQQAFNYKNNQPGCKYVITSNFQKLRFYIDYADEHEEFDLFHLNREDFELLYLILSKDSVFADIPLKLKTESVFHEENVSKQLYKDYSVFKSNLFDNLVKNNSDYDKLTLFKKSQKLIDRFLFMLFAEDRGLLPPNYINRIIKRFEILKKEDAYKPLYIIYKQYFGYMNIGRKAEDSSDDIPAYNGGLFYPDKILDNLKIDDSALIDDLRKLSTYDFNSEVDVNILGHIFEHSLSEIEEITAELEGITADKTKSKRKKDGVFYTPRYITQYIVENTIGALCKEKRAELDIAEIEFDGSFRLKKGKLSAKGQKLYDKLDEYKKWLLSLKIVDPACGSGAFLNQALNFLIEEHKIIDDIIAELTNTHLRIFDTDKAILENNLYGVDINEESIEIAKLSLWLRTAQKGRKLSVLSDNIKCGNSLIDDPEVAGDKAFNWQEEFPEIMQKGGFDVVIGNPPWGAKIPKNQKLFINSKYLCNKGEIETYVHFTDTAINALTKKNGFIGLITPNTWYYLDKYLPLRKNLINKEIRILIELEKRIFIDAPDIMPAIFIIKNSNVHIDNNIKTYKLDKGAIPTFLIDRSIFSNYIINTADWEKLESLPFNLQLTPSITNIILRVQNNSVALSELFNTRYGIKTGNNTKYVKKTNEIENLTDNWKYCIASASSIRRYKLNWELDKLNFGEHLAGYSENSFERRKILIQYIRKLSMPKRLIATLDDEGKFYPLNNFSFIEEKTYDIKLKFLLTVINSQMMNFYFKNVHIDYNIKPKYIAKLPIKNLSLSEQQPFIDKADKMLGLNQQLQGKKSKFLNRVRDNFELEKITKKLNAFYDFDFKTFVGELKKQKIKLSLLEQDEWEEYFTAYKTEINNLQTEIATTDKNIDQMVYKLYNLTEDEIKIVEGSC